MGLFNKLFGGKEKDEASKKVEKPKDVNLFEKEIVLDLDEKFAKNFTENGGKFIYCLKEQELLESINLTFDENTWDDFLSFDPKTDDLLDRIGIPHSNQAGTNCAFICKCEALIADNGSILISSNQLKGRKLIDLPYDFLILASVNQLVEDRSEGLRRINMVYQKNIPSNITTIKGPKTVTGTNNILDSGSINTSKSIYLLLSEKSI